MPEPSFNFGPNANQSAISNHSLEVLEEILIAAGLSSCVITSTSRTPAAQARAMFNNIVKYGVAHQKSLYGAAGDKVIDVYVEQKNAGKNTAQIMSAMEMLIINIGPGKVSHHCADPKLLNVLDISPSSISNKTISRRRSMTRSQRRKSASS